MNKIAVAAATLLLIATTYFSASRDFGDFVIATMALPALLLIALIAIGVAAWFDWRSRGVKLALMLLLATPLFAFASFHLHDRVRFAAWSALHYRALERATQQDGVLTAWDSWGFGGDGNDAYLISDVADQSSTLASAEQWRKRLHLNCPLVASERMAAKVYMVTTSNCVFDISAANRKGER